MAKVVAAAVLMIFGLYAAVAKAQSPPTNEKPILIVEIQTASASSSTEEFVELYNRSHKLLSAEDKGLKLQYKSASGTSWLTKASLSGELQPRGRYLIATSGYLDDTDHETGLGLAAGGGHLRVISEVDGSEVEYDQMAWGSAESPLNEAADEPAGGQSLKRLADEDGHFIDSDNDKADFIISDNPTPESAKPLPKISDGDEFKPSAGNLGDGGFVRDASSNNGRSSASLKISEMFIDPGKPLSDADDEFVEIFNPTKESVDLEDYVIKTGSSLSYSFTLPSISIKSGEYLALFSIDTGLILSNSGGAAVLYGPDGKTVYEVPPYSNAKTDTSWAEIDGNWQWTNLPTPNAANVAGGTGEDDESITASSGALAAVSAQDGRAVYEEPPQAPGEVNTAVVAGVGTMALLYAGYEYRYDLGNAVHKLRRYLESRRSSGKKT